MFDSIYRRLCEDRKINKHLWKPKSGIHKHHIIPKHAGGNNTEANLTYLTVREHIIAHYLLWKIYKNPNDLRSMKMLGAKLTYLQRRIVGIWCKNNKIGWHEHKKEWAIKGVETQKRKKVGIHNPENYDKFASLGGKASWESPNGKWKYWTTKEGRSERGKRGAAALAGRKVMYKPGDLSFKRISLDKVEEYLSNGYIFGSPLSFNKKKVITSYDI